MTTVTIIEYDDAWEIEAKNHADTPEVCAAISMVLTTLANWELKYGEETASLLPGDSRVVITRSGPGPEAICSLAELAFEALAEDEKIILEKVQMLGKNRKGT